MKILWQVQNLNCVLKSVCMKYFENDQNIFKS